MPALRDYYLIASAAWLNDGSEGGTLLLPIFIPTGGPAHFPFTAQDHVHEFVDAFYSKPTSIAQDRANTIVILTGAGGGFIPEYRFRVFGTFCRPAVWSQSRQGVQWSRISPTYDWPMIAAIEGRAHVAPPKCLLAM